MVAILLFGVANPPAGAVAAAAAAATAAGPLLPDQVDHNGCHHRQKHQSNHQGTPVFSQPVHQKNLFSILYANRNIPQGLALPVGPEQQVHHGRQAQEGDHRPHAEGRLTGEEPADLVDHHGHHVGEAAHVADGAQGPLPVVHLPLDGAHGREAGGAQEVEDHEAVGGETREGRGDGGIDAGGVLHQIRLAGVLEGDAEEVHHLLLGDEAGDGGTDEGPGALPDPAQGVEEPGHGVADRGQQGVVGVRHRAEGAALKAVAHKEPQDDRAEEDHGAGPLDEGPAPVPGAPQDVAHSGRVIGGQLHDKGGGLAGEHPKFLEHDAGDHHRGDADEEGGYRHPGAVAEDGSGKEGDDGDLGAAGDEAGGHDGHLPVPVLLDGPGGQDAGDAAAGGHQHGDEALAREAEAPEDPVHDEGDAGHVADVLQDAQQEHQHQNLGHKAQHCANARHDAVLDETVEPAALGHMQRAQKGVKPAGHQLAEEHVVGPVGAEGADADAAVRHGGAHGDGVDQHHHRREDGQGQNPVGDDFVDLVRDGEAAPVLFLIAAVDDGADPVVALAGDNGLGAVIQLLLAGPDVLLHVRQVRLAELQLLDDLPVPLEDLDGEPALLLLGHVVEEILLNVGQGVLHGAGEAVLGDGLFAALGDVHRLLGGLHDAGAL